MSPNWLRHTKQLISRSSTPVRRPHKRLGVELLEDRTLPATATWTGAAGDLLWSTAANWSGGSGSGGSPGSSDNVVIPDGTETITLSGSVTIASLQSGATVNITGGTFAVNGSVTNPDTQTGTVTIAGGTLSAGGTNWTNTEAIHLNSGTLNLGGSFTTADIGTIARTGGTAGAVNITGTLTNTGATLALDTTANGIGTITVVGGTIIGGTVTTATGTQLQLGSNSTLNGVTLTGLAILTGSATIAGDLTLTTGSTLNYPQPLPRLSLTRPLSRLVRRQHLRRWPPTTSLNWA